ncbi:MAG TPA: class I SAM-dependent methyltransferase [Syntrophales bacterium]|nr:class I SAM-dependent methyltransferase [Syntrophales bacterium]
MFRPVADHFVRFAPSYDRVNHILSLGLDVHWRARLIAEIEDRQNLRILDLCAGTLACTRDVLERFPHAHVTAVDFCRPMLDYGLSRLTEPMRAGVEVICSDVLDLELAPASFDIVICSCGLRHLPEQEALLEKIRRWLLPEGQFIILDFFRPTTTVSKLFHSTAGKYLLPAVADLLKGYRPAYLNLYVSIKHFSSRAEYERLLITQKYAVRRSEDLTFGIVSLIAAAPLVA